LTSNIGLDSEFFSAAERGEWGFVYLSTFVYIQMCALYFVFNEVFQYFIVMLNRFNTNRKDNKNPALPTDFIILIKKSDKPKV
jgi:hypothetical protein